jgi:hypothetical protein
MPFFLNKQALAVLRFRSSNLAVRDPVVASRYHLNLAGVSFRINGFTAEYRMLFLATSGKSKNAKRTGHKGRTSEIYKLKELLKRRNMHHFILAEDIQGVMVESKVAS